MNASKAMFLLSFLLLSITLKAERIWSIDFAKGDKTLKLYNGAKIVDDNGKKVLDLGYKQPGSKAYATADIPVADLRSGSISFRFRPGYNLLTKRKDSKDNMYRCIMKIPTDNGFIQVDWYNRFGPWLHFYLNSCKNDNKNLQTGLHGVHTPNAKSLNVAADTWKDVLVNWTPKQTKMFVDGKLVGERVVEDVTPAELLKGIIYMGAWNNMNAGDLQLADIAIYNSVETPESIKVLQEKVIAVGGPGTLLYANPRKHYQAPKFTTAPKIDGKINDAVWKKAPILTGFVRNTIGREFVNKQSVAKLGWDDKNLYVAVICFENKMDHLRAIQKKHDGAVYSDDACEFIIVPDNGNLKDYYQFIVNAIGTRLDAHRSNIKKYNPQWTAAVSRGKNYWTAEIAIPFSSFTNKKVVNGNTMRFIVSRDRQAGNGIDNLSASAEISGGFLTPEEYDFLDLVNVVPDVKAFETALNKPFAENTIELLKKKITEAEKDKDWGLRIIKKTKSFTTDSGKQNIAEAQNVSAKISEKINTVRNIIQNKNVSAMTLAWERTNLDELDDILKDHSDKINQIGFGNMEKYPDNLPNGISTKDQFSFIKTDKMVMILDNSTGMISGIFDKNKKRIAAWSFDIYNLNTKKNHSQSDERMDTVKKFFIKGNSIVFECHNDILMMNIRKTYRLPEKTSANDRIIAKVIEATADTKEHTLLTVISRMRFDDQFIKEAFYHRVIASGLLGEKRSFFKASEIKQPIALTFFFSVSTPAILSASNLQNQTGLAQYWYSANGNWVLPQGGHDFQTLLSPTSWDLSHFITFLKPDKAVKGEIRYHLFDGNHVHFHTEYRDSPERLKALEGIEPVSNVAKFRRYILNVGMDVAEFKNPLSANKQKFDLFYPRLRSNEYASHFGMPNMDHWHGDYPAEDGASVHLAFKPEAPVIPAEKVKKIITAGNAMWPKVVSGWYRTPQNICFHSNLAKTKKHLIMIGKDGNPVPSGWSPFMGIGNYTDEYWDLVVERLAKQMDYYESKVMYLDYTVFGALADWGNGEVRYSENHVRFLRKLYAEVHKRGGYLFTNGVTTDGIHDITYYEGWGKYNVVGRSWQDSSDAILLRRLYEREGVRTIPLYWYGGDAFSDTQRNYRDYTNLILSQLVTPIECWHDPYDKHFKNPATGNVNWKAVYMHSVPYFDFSFEIGYTKLAEVDLYPNWYLKETDNLEAYCFKKNNTAYIFTALRHESVNAPVKTITLKADANKMKFDKNRETFVWHFKPRDPDKYPRHGGKQPENWEQLFDSVSCETASVSDGTLRVRMVNAPSFLTQVSAATQIPAVFVSLENKPLVTKLPEVLDNKISGTIAKGANSYKLTAETILPAEILVYLPAGSANKIAVNGKKTSFTIEKYGNLSFGRISLAKGNSEITINK